MKLPSALLLALLAASACNRQKELTEEEKAAALRKDNSDIAEKLATGKDAEARKDLLEKAKEGKLSE